MFPGVSLIDAGWGADFNAEVEIILFPSNHPLQKRNFMKNFKQLIASCLIFCITAAGFPMAAQASIVTTDEVTSASMATTNRNTVNAFLTRDDVQKSMQAQGVSPQAAIERVNAMSDSEVAQLAGRVDQAPAGGEVLGLIFTVFIVLLVTDILGLTKVFPFTRSVR